jgi:DNA-binding LytR/AlgR family response regulator
LDIAMPVVDGFQLIERLGKDIPPAVIFTTAFDQHAVSAFENSALDYLLKPVSSERLSIALARARSALEARNNGRRVQELMEVISSSRADSRWPESRPVLWASRGRELVKVAVSELLWLKAEGDYVRLYSEQGEGLTRGTLTRLALHLDPAVFLRVHRSAIVRKSQIRRVRRKPTGAVVAELICGSEVPVGRQYARGIRDLLRKLPG